MYISHLNLGLKYKCIYYQNAFILEIDLHVSAGL